MSRHKTERIILKYVDVDEKMVPLVQWLNLQHGIQTQFCCQGDDEGAMVLIYVFAEAHALDVASLLWRTGIPGISIEKSQYDRYGMRYMIRIDHHFHRDRLMQWCLKELAGKPYG